MRKFLTMSQVAIFEKPCEKIERYLSTMFFSGRIDKWKHKFQSWPSWQQVYIYLFPEYGHIIMNYWKRIDQSMKTYWPPNLIEKLSSGNMIYFFRPGCKTRLELIPCFRAMENTASHVTKRNSGSGSNIQFHHSFRL